MFSDFPLFLTVFLGLSLCTALPSRVSSEPKFRPARHTVPLYLPLQGYISNGVFSADITVGSQTLRAALDTGSSDTWFLADNANCTSAQTLQAVPIDQCGYSGPKYVPNGTFERIPDIHFNGTYGTGETINGPLGYTELDFGGINIPKQIVSAATYASVGGVPEGNVSGIIGLTYAANTNAFPGTDPSMDVLCTNNSDSGSCGPQNYSPFVTTIFNDNLTRSTFAFALSRSQTSGGVMTLGGIPNLHVPDINATHGVVATVPIELYANLRSLRGMLLGLTPLTSPTHRPMQARDSS